MVVFMLAFDHGKFYRNYALWQGEIWEPVGFSPDTTPVKKVLS